MKCYLLLKWLVNIVTIRLCRFNKDEEGLHGIDVINFVNFCV
jgi:hypothetical protein